MASALPPLPVSSSANDWMRSMRRAPSTTLAPCAESSRAVASPSPLLAPVMTTTFPSMLLLIILTPACLRRRLAVDHGHDGRVVARPGDLPRRERVVERAHLCRVERDRSGGDILLQVLDALRARNRHDVRSLVEQPGQRNLSWLDAKRPSHLSHRLRRVHVGVEVLSLVAGVAASEVALGVLLCPLDLARQEAAAKRRERHQADAELANRRKDVRL